MTRALGVYRLAAVTGLVVAAFVAGTSVWKGEKVVPFPEAQAEATGETTVRISAKRLDNQGTEFGLQVRSDGAWGPAERLLPSSRSAVPADAEVGRWLRSSPLELDSGHVVRITAQLLDDGRIEFGLHEDIDGEAGERLLPETRMFPRVSETDLWRNTSALVLAGTEVKERFTPVVGVSGQASAAIEFSSWHDDDGVHTFVNSRVASKDAVDGALYLSQVCWNSRERRLQIDGLPGPAGTMLVMTSAAPGPQMADFGAVEVDLAVDDGDADTQYWRLIGESGRYTATAGRHATDLLEAMRKAASLTVTLVGSGLPAATFDLNGMFDTRVQGNIDECGNYIDPAWRPLTEEQWGNTDAGAFYRIDYPDHLDGERRTNIHVDADEAPEQFQGVYQGQPVRLRVWCQQGERTFQVEYHPTTDGEYRVRSRIDDGEWTEHTWQIRTTDGGFTYAAPKLDYEGLRQGTTFEIELEIKSPGSIVLPRTFNLETLFGTPVQANIDNCGMPVWPGAYVPLVNVDGSTSDALFWNASLYGDDVFTTVSSLTPVAASPLGFLQLSNSCYGNWRDLSIGELERTDAESLQVTLEIDGVSIPSEAWPVTAVTYLDGTEYSQVDAPDPVHLAALLRTASSLTVTIGGSGLPPVTFDLTGMFDTPIQGNIDNCGNYAPGLKLGLNTGGMVDVGDDGDRVIWSRYRGPAANPFTSVTWAGPAETEGPSFYLNAQCGSYGSFMILFGTRLGELSAGDLDVSWSLDGRPAQRQTWRVSDFQNGFMMAHPVSVPPVLQAWRSGRTLQLTVHNATAHSEQIDLTALFGTPVQSSLDECLAVPAPDLPAPVGEVLRSRDGGLYYDTGKHFGNHVAATTLSITVGEPVVGQRFEIACGISGIQVMVGNISRDQVLVITDDTVEVTWSSDGGDRHTATWDIYWLADNRGQIFVSPQDDAAFYDAIKDADSLSVSVATDPLSTAEFDLAGSGFWLTPIQPNLDACPGS